MNKWIVILSATSEAIVTTLRFELHTINRDILPGYFAIRRGKYKGKNKQIQGRDIK